MYMLTVHAPYVNADFVNASQKPFANSVRGEIIQTSAKLLRKDIKDDGSWWELWDGMIRPGMVYNELGQI